MLKVKRGRGVKREREREREMIDEVIHTHKQGLLFSFSYFVILLKTTLSLVII